MVAAGQCDRTRNCRAALRHAPCRLSAEDADRLAPLRATFEQYVKDITAVVNAAVANQALAQQRFEAIQEADDATDTAIEEISEDFDADVVGLTTDLANAQAALRRLVIVVLVVGALAVAGATVLLGRATTRRMRAVVEGLDHLATGDLAHRVPDGGADEVAVMSRALNQGRRGR